MKICEDVFCCGQMYGNTHCENYIPTGESESKTFVLAPGAYRSFHHMPYSLVIFNTKGCARLHCAERQDIILGQRQMILIAQSSFLEITATRRCILFIMELPECYGFCNNTYREPYENQEIEYDYCPTDMMKPLVAYISNYATLLNGSMFCRKMCDIKRREFFYYLNMLYSPQQMYYFLYPVLGGSVSFRRAVMKHMVSASTATELARCSGYSRCVFYKKFSSEFNMPVKKWIVKQKIEQINMLVTKPGISVKELMYLCGYSSGGHFNDFFKKHFNCTPGEYINHFITEK